MSHGGGGSGETVEVNMIPMIDIVIQLITFFLMLINLDQANVDELVRLPIADLAKPTEANMDEPLVLNIHNDGEVNLLGEKIDTDSGAFRQVMMREARVAQDNMKAAGEKIDTFRGRPKLWTTIMVRADQDVEYGKIQRLMQTCQELGFYKFALRANTSGASM
jgi:biopolymer transport protein ExbD